MITQTKYVLCAYVVLYFLIGWQYIIFQEHDSINPTRFMDMISDNVNVVGFVYILVAILGLVAIIGHKILKEKVWIAKLLLLPQLMVSASSVLSMIISVNSGQYNNGTVLPYHFILKDQEWCLVFFIFNSLSVKNYKF